MAIENLMTKAVILILMLINISLLIIIANIKYSVDESISTDSKYKAYTFDEFHPNQIKSEIADKIFKSNGVDPLVLIIVGDKGCSQCINHEVKTLNAYKEQLGDNVFLISIGRDENFLKNYEVEIEYLHLSNLSEVFKNNIDIPNPISLVIDKNFIYDLRVVTNGKPL